MRRIVVLCLLLVFGTVATLQADPNKKNSGSSNSKSNRAAKSAEMTPEDEASAMQFVQQHHNQLVSLLNHLKENRPQEYARAVRGLSRTSQRLDQFRQRDSQRYKLELRHWKAESRIQLLSARMTMKSDGDLESELRSALGQYHDLRLKILEYNRRQLGEKLERLEQQIQHARENRDKSIETQYKALVDGTARRPRKPQPDRAAQGAPTQPDGKASPPKQSDSKK